MEKRLVGIANRWNTQCFHLAVIQLLHDSTAVEQAIAALLTPHSYSSYVTNMIRPLIVYRQKAMDDETVFRMMNRAYKDLTDQVTNEHVKDNGYVPSNLLLYYYLPIFCKFFNKYFVEICSDVSVPLSSISTVKYGVHHTLRDTPYVKDELIPETIELYDAMADFLTSFTGVQPPLALRSWILEIYPNGRDGTGGHAVFLTRYPNWTVVDDATIIAPLEKYVKERFVFKFVIRGFTSELARELEKVIGLDQFDMARRVGNRFEFYTKDPEYVIHHLQKE